MLTVAVVSKVMVTCMHSGHVDYTLHKVTLSHFEYTEKVLALREVMLRVLCAEDMSSSSANEASLTTSISRLTSHIRGIVDTSREANNHT